MISVKLSVTYVEHIRKSNCENLWYQDCGATQLMTMRKDWLKNFNILKEQIMIGNSTFIDGVGIGEVELISYIGKDWCPLILKNVLYTSKIPFNLFSVVSALDEVYFQKADAKCAYIIES